MICLSKCTYDRLSLYRHGEFFQHPHDTEATLGVNCIHGLWKVPSKVVFSGLCGMSVTARKSFPKAVKFCLGQYCHYEFIRF